jgi:hypothetical protein
MAKVKLPTYERIQVPEIAFLGVWDTVDAYGMPIQELKTGIDRMIWPMSFRTDLSPKVRRARQALSLDDDRRTFYPVVWDENNENDSERIKQVWFAGAHANVGGGYPDDGLAYGPLLWIIREAQDAGLKFEPRLLRLYDAAVTPFGKIYDPRDGRAAFYRYAPRRVDHTRPHSGMKRGRGPYYKDWALIHHTVFARIKQGQYAPISIGGPTKCVGSSSTCSQTTGEMEAVFDTEWRRQMKVVFDTVWWRQAAYWTMMLISLVILMFPWLTELVPASLVAPQAGARALVAGSIIVPLIKLLAPGFTSPWIEAFVQFPLTFTTLVFCWVVTFFWGLSLRHRVADRALAAWRRAVETAARPERKEEQFDEAEWLRNVTSRRIYAVEGVILLVATLVFLIDILRTKQWFLLAVLMPPGVAVISGLTEGVSLNILLLKIARFFRTNPWTRRISRDISHTLIPSLFVAILILGGPLGAFYALNQVGFGLLDAAGAVCKPTTNTTLLEKRDTRETRTFDISNPCFATGVRLEKGAKYRIILTDPSQWKDGAIDLAALENQYSRPRLPTDGYGSLEKSVYTLAWAPMRRFVKQNWLRPIARVGRYGEEEHPLGATSTLIEPRRTGELYLYVNEAVLGIPWYWDVFYRDIRGTVTVQIWTEEDPSMY